MDRTSKEPFPTLCKAMQSDAKLGIRHHKAGTYAATPRVPSLKRLMTIFHMRAHHPQGPLARGK